jgi:ADP-ribose pyrophosphatase YjhB (NUDIX family)
MVRRDYLTYVGAYGICVDDARRLLLARIREDTPDDGKWTLPGGGLLYGETPEAAVRREIEEETGLIAEPGAILGTSVMTIDRSTSFDGARLHFVGILYRVRIVGGELRDEVGGTTDACGWFDRERISTMPLVWLVERDALPLAFPDDAR